MSVSVVELSVMTAAAVGLHCSALAVSTAGYDLFLSVYKICLIYYPQVYYIILYGCFDDQILTYGPLLLNRVTTGPGKSWKSHRKVTHNVVKFFTTALRNSVMNVSSECVDSFHYYNQLKLLLIILVCIHMSCFVYLGKM